MSKKCSQCLETKELIDFYKCKARSDNLQIRCKNCSVLNTKKQRKREKEARHKRGLLRSLKATDEERRFKKKLSDRRWKDNNPKRARINKIKYSKRVKQATPNWLSEEQVKEIDMMYWNRPNGYHVDHIVPLKGKIVCGLHVPWNLQYLLKRDNLKKNNKF